MSVQEIGSLPREAAVVQKQIHLPFSKAWQISIQSIKIRLARSLITAAGVFLGIAFFSSVRTGILFPPSGNPLDPEVIAAGHRQQWLAIMALLVCAVGITNSMLMSVTERFKEIGTMKCLGALNRFVVTLFFIEAGLMGLVASFLGWFAGWAIICVTHLLTGGAKDFTSAFWKGSVFELCLSMFIGIAITLFAAIPPANRAASMPAAVALRTEI